MTFKTPYVTWTHNTLHLRSIPNLEKLILDGCNDLVEFQMPAESLMLEELYLSHSKLRTLDLGLTPNLKKLNLENCYDLVDINAPVGYLKKLAFVDLSCCGRFKSFVFDKELDSDELGFVSELHLKAEPTDVGPLHCDNDYLQFQFSCFLTDSASSCGNLERLISRGFSASINHESFSRSISSLQGLKKFALQGNLTEAPPDLDQLECLEELIFSFTMITYLPDSICKMKRINSFDLRGCIRVVELPEEIGSLESLKELNIEGTGITRLPQSIFTLRGLRIVWSTWLLDTYGLLLKRRRTSDDDDEIVCYI